MSPILKRADGNFSTQVSQVIAQVWPDQVPPDDYLTAVLSDPATHCLIASDWPDVLGFCGGFMTTDLAGRLRWEVDLLAVVPAARGNWLAVALVDASLNYASSQGARYARAAVRVGNTPAERTFAHAEFSPQLPVRKLIVVPPAAGAGSETIPTGIVPVMTLTYRGLWIEAPPTPDLVRATQRFAFNCGLSTVGILCSDSDVATVAQACPEYAEIGQFHVMLRDL